MKGICHCSKKHYFRLLVCILVISILTATWILPDSVSKVKTTNTSQIGTTQRVSKVQTINTSQIDTTQRVSKVKTTNTSQIGATQRVGPVNPKSSDGPIKPWDGEWDHYFIKPLFPVASDSRSTHPSRHSLNGSPAASAADVLGTSQVPRVLHATFCPSVAEFAVGGFPFQRYVTLAGAIKAVRPHVVYLYHSGHKRRDKWMYNTWLDELRHEFPFINVTRSDEACLGADKPSMDFVFRRLRAFGGLYADDGVLVNDVTRHMVHGVFSARSPRRGLAVVGSTPQGLAGAASADAAEEIFLTTQVRLSCHSVQEVNKMAEADLQGVVCVELDPAVNIYPRDLLIPADDCNFFRLVRWVLYGQLAIPRAQPSPEPVIPNVGHYVWFSGGSMDYLFYLSVLSLLHVAKVDQVYVHGEVPPSGPHWRWLKDHRGEKVAWVYRPRVRSVYGHQAARVEHQADLARHDVMFHHGGIHMDADAMFVQTPPEELRRYDVVTSLDNYVFPMSPYPDVLNLGVTMTRPYSRFMDLYRQAERFWDDKDYVWNSNRVSYKIYERNPELILLEPRLQVICFDLECYPTWIPSSRRPEAMLLAGNATSWRDRVLAFHWTHPNPTEFSDEATLRAHADTLFGSLGKHVLIQAGLW